MKLTMQMFYDRLQEFHPKADITSNHFEIETVRLFSSDVMMESNTLYVGKMRDLFVNGTDRVICTHNNDMILLETEDLESVLNVILNMLSFYANWSNRMLELLASGAMLQDLFDASEQVIIEPVFLLDAAQRKLGMHPGFGEGDVDSRWDELLKYGAASLEFLIEFNRRDPIRQQRHGIYTYDNGVLPNEAYHYNFFAQNNFVGSATIIVRNGQISQGNLDLFLLFCQFLDRWFQNHIQEQQSVLLDNQLRQAISDAEFHTAELQHRLKLHGWKSDNQIVMLKLDAPLQPYSINTHLCQTINALFSEMIAIVHELSICVLWNKSLSTEKSHREYWKTLQYFLQSSKYYGTVGQPFTMGESFYRQYRYLSIISQYVEKNVGEIYVGNDYHMHYIFREMQHTVISEVIHPAVPMLRQYDQEHGTEFYQTMYSYVKNGCSFIKTVNELKLHRNTLVYRIKRLGELLEGMVDLEQDMERLHLWISFEIDK